MARLTITRRNNWLPAHLGTKLIYKRDEMQFSTQESTRLKQSDHQKLNKRLCHGKGF